MKTLVFKFDGKTHLVSIDCTAYSVIQKWEEFKIIGYTGTIQIDNTLYSIDDKSFVFGDVEYYQTGYSGLSKDELNAVANTHDEELIREVFLANEFTNEEIDQAFKEENIYKLLT